MEGATIPARLHRETPVVDVVPPRPLRCRNCLRLGHHDTYDCKEYAEYYSVSISKKAKDNKKVNGCCWPDIAVHKIIGVHAGPVIKYFERAVFKEELTRDAIFVMFAFIANTEVCFRCGATGHSRNSKLNSKYMCEYLPRNGDRPTGSVFADMASREVMCKRMRGLREKQSLARIQHTAEKESVCFWERANSHHSAVTSGSAESVKRGAENFAESSRATKLPKFNGELTAAMGNKPEISRPVMEEFHSENSVNTSALSVKANGTGHPWDSEYKEEVLDG